MVLASKEPLPTTRLWHWTWCALAPPSEWWTTIVITIQPTFKACLCFQRQSMLCTQSTSQALRCVVWRLWRHLRALENNTSRPAEYLSATTILQDPSIGKYMPDRRGRTFTADFNRFPALHTWYTFLLLHRFPLHFRFSTFAQAKSSHSNQDRTPVSWYRRGKIWNRPTPPCRRHVIS